MIKMILLCGRFAFTMIYWISFPYNSFFFYLDAMQTTSFWPWPNVEKNKNIAINNELKLVQTEEK